MAGMARLGRGPATIGAPIRRSAMPRSTTSCRAPVQQRRAARAVALLAAQPASSSVEVALDFYKLLQVSHVASRDTVTKAYEKCLSNPPGVGYSPATLSARGSLLKGAMATLLDPPSRADYDERLLVGDVVEEVPAQYVAGALALLQEAGEGAAVVAAGERWLTTHRQDASAADVGLAVAAARCDLAQRALEEQGDVVQSVGHMEAALKLLRQHRVGGGMQEEVDGALQELQPQLALALLARPLEDAQGRAKGMAVAEQVLRGGGSRRGLTFAAREDFLRQLAASLTAGEQVRLYEACGTSFAESPGQLYDVAMAHIAQGAASLAPAQLQKAAALLQLPAPVPAEVPESQRAKRAAEDRNRRAVALAVCHLLLGRAAEAEAALGLAPTQEGGTPTPKCDRAVLQFIKSNSPDKEDPLPGLCVLAQRWIHDVAFASFRAAHDAQFSLDAWFAAPQVQRAIQAIELGGSVEAEGNPVGSALEQGMALLTAPFVHGIAAALSLVGLLANPDGAPSSQRQQPSATAPGGLDVVLGSSGSDDMASVDMRRSRQARQAAWAEQQAAQRSTAAAPDWAPSPASQSDSAQPAVSSSSNASGSENGSAALQPREEAPQPGTPVSSSAAASATAGQQPDGRRFSRAPSPQAGAEVASQGGDGAGAGALLDPANADLDEFASQPVPRPVPLAGEEWMVEAYETRYVRWGRIVAAGAALLVGGLVLGRGALLPAGLGLGPAAGRPPAIAVVGAGEEAASAGGEGEAGVAAAEVAISRKEAADIIARWHQIKTDALGPGHAVGKLDRVLTGSVLEQWRERAAAIKEKGWHYTHSLEACQVDALGAGASPGSVALTATFRETAELHKGGEEEPQPFRSEYRVAYELVKEKGLWKISAAQVQY